MNLRNLSIGLLAVSFCMGAARAQTAPCRDAADEPHHRVVLGTSAVRILLLDLPRIASTEQFCYASPYVYIVLGEGRSSTTREGQGTVTHGWSGSEAHIVYNPLNQVVRNETGQTFREVIVELRRGLEYHRLEGQYDTELFPSGLGTVKPTWTTSFQRGGVQFSNTQLAVGDIVKVNASGHLLIALNDVRLQPGTRGDGEEINLQAQELTNLPDGTVAELTNTGRSAARFILIEY